MLFAQGVVEETRQHMFFLVQAAQTIEELFLGFAMHHEIGAGDQQLNGYLNRLGIGYDPFGGFVETEQDIHGNGLGDQRVVVVAGDALRVMTEEPRLDVAVDEKVAAPLAHQRQPLAGERHIQLDLERRRRQHQRAYAWRVIVSPGGDDHRADALGDHREIFLVNLVSRLQVLAEGLHVAHAGGKARAVATGARREAMAPGIPGKEVVAGQVQFIHQVGNAARVFMAAMKQQYGLAWFVRCRVAWPVSVEQFHAIMGGECLLASFAHCQFLRLKSRLVVLP
ncbi:hypothetical protein D3C71_1430170 [compost metagenome]